MALNRAVSYDPETRRDVGESEAVPTRERVSVEQQLPAVAPLGGAQLVMSLRADQSKGDGREHENGKKSKESHT